MVRADQAMLSRPWGGLKARTLPAISISVLREGKSHGLRQYPDTIPWQKPRQPANQCGQDDFMFPIWPRMRATGSNKDRPRLSPMHLKLGRSIRVTVNFVRSKSYEYLNGTRNSL